MNRLVRFSSAGLGMVMLAGLASYQGRSELAPDEQDKLSGTALVEVSDINESNCESMTGLDGRDADDCIENERSSDTD